MAESVEKNNYAAKKCIWINQMNCQLGHEKTGPVQIKTEECVQQARVGVGEWN